VPSLPAIVTCVASTAVTVSKDEDPEVIDGGFAAICTVGAGLAVTVRVTADETFPPAPVAVAV